MAPTSLWDDGTQKAVKSLKTTYGYSAVHSIEVEYESEGNSFWAPKRGGSGGEESKEIKLNLPSEYLTSVTGYYTTINSEDVIKSIKFTSNLRTHGPFGLETGRYFAVVASRGNKIVGLKGKNGNFLNSIEAHFAQIPSNVSSAGPFGGSGGDAWDDGKDHSGVRQISIGYNKRIHSIQVQYEDDAWADFHGGKENDEKRETIKLEYPDEYLISVSGYYATSSSAIFIQGLIIQSNRKTYGPVGAERGRYFSLYLPNKMIVSFHGRSGAFLDSIGAHFVPVPHGIFSSVGPFGGSTGKFWDDGEHSGIRQIKLVYASEINSITVEYDDDGVSTWAAKRGGNDGTKTEIVALEFPDEFLISVSGYTWDNRVHSLTFESNKRSYGPFGPNKGSYFSFPSSANKIVGFFGRSDNLLNAIGAHWKPARQSYTPFYVAPFGGTGGYIWDDGVYTTVRKIEVGYGTVIDSIRVEYDNNGRSAWGDKRGANSASKIYAVELEFPVEYVVSISGHMCTENSLVIQSLKIETNKRTYGPFGTERGETFSLGATGSKIVGFHGRAGASLSAIGLYTMPLPMPTPYEMGGLFGILENPERTVVDGVYDGIKKIEVGYGQHVLNGHRFVDYLRVEYDKNGRSVWSLRRGNGPKALAVIELDYPNEYIVSMSGRYRTGSDPYLTLLSFQSNTGKKYGPYGYLDGTSFTFNAPPNGKFVGFRGRSGTVVDSIGAFTAAITKSSSSLLLPSEFFEPQGGAGGNQWDDGVFDAVRKIYVGRGQHGIQYIGIEYEKDGETKPVVGHGEKPATAELLQEASIVETPGEFLISISGYTDDIPGFATPFIQSLTFHTNKRKVGPFGSERGKHFSSENSAGRIVGFHGRAGMYLDAIGIHTKPIVDSSIW